MYTVHINENLSVNIPSSIVGVLTNTHTGLILSPRLLMREGEIISYMMHVVRKVKISLSNYNSITNIYQHPRSLRVYAYHRLKEMKQ